ncbi:uncharacterized protein LOC108737391 [Agrilus planipennis]|uniref:Uncharacterized protein LOC108737391 n=1 Tax=Agrilus planipennis TaxID=224129 RepID=A0A7F5RIN6_AGRPL|nr:uncharacterized protein LOC108737391 [Agrilus planipennis]
MGKFSINNVLEATSQQLRPFKHTNGNNHQQSRRLHTRKLHGDLDHYRAKRTKGVDQFSDCDNTAFTLLAVGCSSPDTMEFHPPCFSPDVTSSYSCHGRWEENGTNYLIASPTTSRSSHGALKYCFIYKEYGPDTVLFSTSSGNCDRNLRPGITGELVLNASWSGKCVEVNRSHRLQSSFVTTTLLPICFIFLSVTAQIQKVLER